MKCKDCPLFLKDPYHNGRPLLSVDGSAGNCCKDPVKVLRNMEDPGCAYGREQKLKRGANLREGGE